MHCAENIDEEWLCNYKDCNINLILLYKLHITHYTKILNVKEVINDFSEYLMLNGASNCRLKQVMQET